MPIWAYRPTAKPPKGSTITDRNKKKNKGKPKKGKCK